MIVMGSGDSGKRGGTMIEIRDIPPSQVHGMARITLEGAKAFFADPENQKRFEVWQKERRVGRKETA